jgi:UDP-glucose 4-epimerase
MSEDMTPKPEDPYGIAKYAVELDLESAHRLFGLNSIIFRPHNVYGENQNVGDRYRNVIGIFMNQIMNNKSLTVFGDGEQSRAFSYIDDVAPIIANSVNVKEAYNNVFNIGADSPSSVNKLITIIAKEFNVEPSITYCEARNEVTHAYCSHEKLNEIFPNQKQTDIETGIRRMAAWAKIAGAQQSNVFSNIEILENLPPIWKTS